VIQLHLSILLPVFKIYRCPRCTIIFFCCTCFLEVHYHQKLNLLFEFHNQPLLLLLYLNQEDLLSNLYHYILLLPVFGGEEDYHQKLNLLFEYLLLIILAVPIFKPGGTVVQLAPLYSSVAPVRGGDYHQNLNLLFVYHNLLNKILLCLNFLLVDQLCSIIFFCCMLLNLFHQYHQKLKHLSLCSKTSLKKYLAVFILLPVAQVPASGEHQYILNFLKCYYTKSDQC
jgi:hypothetical protein